MISARRVRRWRARSAWPLEENLGAIALDLTADDLREIDAAASAITIEGARYPASLEARTGL